MRHSSFSRLSLLARLAPLGLLPALLLAGCASPRAGVDAAPETTPAAAPASAPPRPRLVEQVSGTTELLQAVSAVDARVAWVSGHGATYARTTDGGATWTPGTVAGAPDSLQFRDVHALDADRAWLLAAGPGSLSRIYHTADGGSTWTLQWTNPEPDGFYDCIDVWDERRGLAYGDAVDGTLRILTTDDGGATWTLVPGSDLPPALPGEGGFAASGLCVETAPGGLAWIGAGNASAARVLRSTDWGRSWQAVETPIVAGEGAGLTAVSMVDARRGFAFGGAVGDHERHTDNVARTDDAGATWTRLPRLPFPGAAYGGLAVPPATGADTARGPEPRGPEVVPGGPGAGPTLVAVGPRGLALSADGGRTWTALDDRAWWGVGSAGPDATWVVGPDGRVARVVW